MDGLASRFPDLAKTGSIGQSVLGKELKYIVISNEVKKRPTLRPMVKMIGKAGECWLSVDWCVREHARGRDRGQAAPPLPGPLPPPPV